MKTGWTDGEPWDETVLEDLAVELNAKAVTVNTIAALRAVTTAIVPVVRILGYYAAGDGGGGMFRWDSTDTTSTDNGGTIITPSGGLSSSGRWKRIYEGEVNARWFGVNPSQADSTAALQKAVDWVCEAYPTIGGAVFIPMGFYSFKFAAGTSGLSTITIDANNVTICGEAKGTQLLVTNNARPNQVNYFFTFTQAIRGQGGGVRDINFYGNSMLKWCIYLSTWRDMEFSNISAYDIHGGVLDAVATNVGLLGESIVVHHIDVSGTTGDFATQYGVRFRAGATDIWSDCSVRDLDIIGCWDTGLVLDGAQRFTVSNVTAALNHTESNTIDGTSKTGCLHAVSILQTAYRPHVGGYHVIDSVYLENGTGTATPDVNNAVLIHEPAGVDTQIHWNKISNVTVSDDGVSTVGLLKIVDDSGFGRVKNTTFIGNRGAVVDGNIIIGAGVEDTDLYLTPDDGRDWNALISDAGTRTRINGGAGTGIVNVLDHGADPTGTTSSSAAVTAAIDAAVDSRGGSYPGSAASMRSVVWFPPGTYVFGAQTLTDGVWFDGMSARLRPTAGFTGDWITISGRFAGIGRGVWLNGNNVNGERGIKVTSASWHGSIDCSMDNWAGKCIRTEGNSTHINSDYVAGMLNTTYINSLSAGSYAGVVEIAGNDANIGRVEINAARTSGGLSVAASTNRVVAALLMSGGMNMVEGAICEQADIGVYNTGFFNKYKNVRTEFNTTHGFWASAGSGEIVGCQALGNGRLADNTYDGFLIDTPNGWLFDDNVSRSDNPGDSIKHRSGLNFVQDNLTLGKFISTGGDHKAYQVPVIIDRNINAQTGTTYTFVADDNDRTVTFNNASPVTATVPLFGSIPWPNSTVIELVNLGAGVVTVTGGGGGPTVNGTATMNQYEHAKLLKTGTNTWVML